MKKRISIIFMAVILIAALSACSTEADKVSYNLSKEADNFNITRRLLVMNLRDNTIILQAVGKISIHKDNADNQLEITVETSPGCYEKNFVGLNEWVCYTVEQCDPAVVSKYGYELEWMPESIIPIRITNNE